MEYIIYMKRQTKNKGGRPPKPANERKIKHPTCYDPDIFMRLTRIAHENRVSIGQVVNSLLRKAFEAQ